MTAFPEWRTRPEISPAVALRTVTRALSDVVGRGAVRQDSRSGKVRPNGGVGDTKAAE